MAGWLAGVRFWLPSVSRGWLFPPRKCAPVLAVVKQTALDDGCGPAWTGGAGSNLKNGPACGVGSWVAGPGSDFSEAPVLGSEPAALEPVAAPTCPPGPVCRAPGAGDHLVAGHVGEPALQAPHGLPGCLAGGHLAVVAGAALGGVAERSRSLISSAATRRRAWLPHPAGGLGPAAPWPAPRTGSCWHRPR
jgi:hypothetical protein